MVVESDIFDSFNGSFVQAPNRRLSHVGERISGIVAVRRKTGQFVFFEVKTVILVTTVRISLWAH